MDITYSGVSYRTKKTNFKKIIFLILLLAVITPSVHAILKHSQDYYDVWNCRNNNGILSRWKNPANGRIAEICQMGENKFGITILKEKGNVVDEVTSFIKNKMSNLSSVERYLENGGYIKQ